MHSCSLVASQATAGPTLRAGKVRVHQRVGSHALCVSGELEKLPWCSHHGDQLVRADVWMNVGHAFVHLRVCCNLIYHYLCCPHPLSFLSVSLSVYS